MVHGSLEDDGIRALYLADALGVDVAGVASPRLASAGSTCSAELVEEHLDVEALLDLATHGAPRSLPVLPPGADR